MSSCKFKTLLTVKFWNNGFLNKKQKHTENVQRALNFILANNMYVSATING